MKKLSGVTKKNLKGLMKVGAAFAIGFAGQTVVEFLNTPIPSIETGRAGLNEISDRLIPVEYSDLEGLNWFLERTKYVMNEKNLANHMVLIDYKIHFYKDLANIPQEEQTTAIRQQLFQGKDEVVINHNEKIIYSTYQTPTDSLIDVILAIR